MENKTPVTSDQIYAQACEDFRSLNQIFWRIPILAMTLNGGLGFALGTVPLSGILQNALLIFMFLCNICFILMLWRIRTQVMQKLLERIREMEGDTRPNPRYLILYIFTIVFTIAALFSLYAAHNKEAVFPRPTTSNPT